MTATSAANEWLTLLDDLTDVLNSSLISPRGMPTHEIIGYQSWIDMNDPVMNIAERKLGYKFMAAEAAWILSGDNRVSTIAPYSKEIASYSDDGVRFFGAYGPPVRDQIGHVVKTLRKDSASRQAVVSIWRSNPPETRDVPCTVSLQWLIRDTGLNCIATMRSSDAWKGWPYDVFNFSMISTAILNELSFAYPNLQLGPLFLTAGSQHLYEQNLGDAIDIVNEWRLNDLEYRIPRPIDLRAFSNIDHLVEWLWTRADVGDLVE